MGTTLKFTVDGDALRSALDVVSIVPPRVTPQGGGFLVVVKGDTAFIYSRDEQHQAKSEIAVTNVEGEGSFVYPSDKTAALRYYSGPISYEVGSDDEDRFWLRYSVMGLMEQVEHTTIDPRLVTSVDKRYDAAADSHTVPLAVLKEGLSNIRVFLPKNTTVEEHFKTVRVFDAAEAKDGAGYMFGADGVRACFFHSDALVGKGLSVHANTLGPLSSFLAKTDDTSVTVRCGDGVTFVTNSRGQMFGWANPTNTHSKFSYYSFSNDAFVLRAQKDLLLKTLRSVRSELDAKKDKIRVLYNHNELSLRFVASGGSAIQSAPVGVKPLRDDAERSGVKGETESFAANVNINQLIDLVDSTRSNEIDIRACIVPAGNGRSKEALLLRTVESYLLSDRGKVVIAAEEGQEAYQCRVTRFMPSRD